MNRPFSFLAATLVLAASACTSMSGAQQAPDSQQVFFDNLASLCGQAFAGRIVADQPAPTGPDPFTGKPLVMGFGISKPDHARMMNGLVDGFIVGSALVRRLLDGGGPEAAGEFVRSLREALDE